MSDAGERGLRLIAYHRPGYGESARHPGRTVADAADDVVAIADALGLDRFLTWGTSGGGPHALACAALRPDRDPHGRAATVRNGRTSFPHDAPDRRGARVAP